MATPQADVSMGKGKGKNSKTGKGKGRNAATPFDTNVAWWSKYGESVNMRVMLTREYAPLPLWSTQIIINLRICLGTWSWREPKLRPRSPPHLPPFLSPTDGRSPSYDLSLSLGNMRVSLGQTSLSVTDTSLFETSTCCCGTYTFLLRTYTFVFGTYAFIIVYLCQFDVRTTFCVKVPIIRTIPNAAYDHMEGLVHLEHRWKWDGSDYKKLGRGIELPSPISRRSLSLGLGIAKGSLHIIKFSGTA